MSSFGEEEEEIVRVFFLPYTQPGHMIPMMNIATLLASRGIKITIITTSFNVSFFFEAVNMVNQDLDLKIDLLRLNFPYAEVGIPEGAVTLSSPNMFYNFVKGLALLQHPFESLVREYEPRCLIVDTFYPWVFNSTSKKLSIPCFAFDGCGYFPHCVIPCIIKHQPHKIVSSDTETFAVPGDLPHEIKFTRVQLPYYERNSKDMTNFFTVLMGQRREAQKSSYGVIVNSFYELESGYADYFKDILGIKSWHIGPVSLCFEGTSKKNGASLAYGREKKSSIDLNVCMSWLDSKEVSSVIYICFGSVSHVNEDQLHEIRMALQSSTHNFILVVREGCWSLDDGFEEMVGKRGLIIKGWAAQKDILEHKSIGGFLTHCGWNSILEGVIAGLPMLTWPLHAEQFYNEKLVTDVLKMGVKIGSKKWLDKGRDECVIIGMEEIGNGIRKLMRGEEARAMRNRAEELKELARAAIAEAGSSCSDLNALIQELKCLKRNG